MTAARGTVPLAAIVLACCLVGPAWGAEDLDPQVVETLHVVNDFARAIAPLDVDPESIRDPHAAAGSLRLRSKLLTQFALKLEGLVAAFPAVVDRASERRALRLDVEVFPRLEGRKPTLATLRAALPDLLVYAQTQAHQDLERATFFASMPAVDDEEAATKRAELVWELNRR